ncbi:MAG TPA: MmcQ/YjbR family DNA-binding protein [Gaiellaceae bacterium]
MADWETVRTIALRLPGAEESTTYGQPAFKVGGKLFAWISPDRRADGALALRIDLDEKPVAIAAEPDVFFETAHYDGHPILLVRLERADPAMLEDRIEESWLLRAPKRLVDAYLAERR